MAFTEIIIVLLLNLAAYSTGGLILKFLGIETDKLNHVLFSMGIGFGFIILALHILGFLKLYYSSVLLGFLLFARPERITSEGMKNRRCCAGV